MELFGEKSAKPRKKKVSTKKVEKKEIALSQASVAHKVLLKPRVTEKSYAAASLNKYIFQVSALATKVLVRKAIKEVYGVEVEDVHMIRIPAKKRNFGRNVGYKSSIKKAIVTLKEGDVIDVMQSA